MSYNDLGSGSADLAMGRVNPPLFIYVIAIFPKNIKREAGYPLLILLYSILHVQ